MSKNTMKNCLKTNLANSGRSAGIGISYDDYSDESGNYSYGGSIYVRLPSDNLTPEEKAALSGEVKTYKGAKK